MSDTPEIRFRLAFMFGGGVAAEARSADGIGGALAKGFASFACLLAVLVAFSMLRARWARRLAKADVHAMSESAATSFFGMENRLKTFDEYRATSPDKPNGEQSATAHQTPLKNSNVGEPEAQ